MNVLDENAQFKDRRTLATVDAVEKFTALSQASRLEAFRLLCRYLPFGLFAGDIARLLALPHNTLSTHLQLLEEAGLIHSKKVGRSVIYVADQTTALGLAGYLVKDCCQLPETLLQTGGPSLRVAISAKRKVETAKISNILILCSGNSARSLMAEAILNREGQGRFVAYSAGSQPQTAPNLYAIELLDALGYETSTLRSKSWLEFSSPYAPSMDFIITVCDKAVGEACQHWFGHPLVVHWGLSDPALMEGSDAEKRAAFRQTYRCLSARVSQFVNLDIERLDLHSLKARLADIGKMEGATTMALEQRVA